MEEENSKIKQIFKWLGVVLVGLVFSVILVIISEVIKFSHTNLIPFGGPSWATWAYPLLISIGFLLSAIIFKIHKYYLVLIVVIIISVIIFYFLFNGLLFVNPIPFGVNAI